MQFCWLLKSQIVQASFIFCLLQPPNYCTI